MNWKTQAEKKTQFKAINLNSLAQLDEYSTPDESLAYVVLKAYLKSAPEQAAGIQSSFKKNSLDTTKQMAHSLKSSSANIGAFTVSKLAEEIENLAADKQTEKLKNAVEKIDSAFSALLKELDLIKKEMEPSNPSQKAS